ncbi:hypothetical protein QMK19_20405 [Streptomyces sp. H10-C2]|uniref:hypothetical protein n=1 Tax=unclassified Streptomyces TaxID=2593676 RepID=UPI0024BB15B0|nr:MULTISPECIES: hypothetical protein [unclassified Streptomyces]MDJ0340752.1 hypothetical protein [Streptomyces sp. PH10-H1]MDJ0371976.1 hypothetical protein [Streptomyces sp. H10-C2]
MTAPSVARLTGVCQAAKSDPELQRFCNGNRDVYAHNAPKGEPPAVRDRCGCTCHAADVHA